MIVLKKINSRLVEKNIQPGQTEEFFSLDISKYEAFDWNIKTLVLSNGQRGITKLSSLYNDGDVDSTAYAFLGKRFNTDVNIFVSVDDYCRLTITNNESSIIRCTVKLKTF